MKYQSITWLFICTALVSFTSCGKRIGGETVQHDYAISKTNEAVKFFYKRFNEDRFNEIADAQSDNVTSEEHTQELLEQLANYKEIYGSVNNIELKKLTVSSGEENKIFAKCIYKINAENGNFFQMFYWIIVDGEAKLFDQQIFNYGKDGELQIMVSGK